MAPTQKQKKKRVRTIPHPQRVADMTTDELRAMIEALIDRKLASETVMSPLKPTITKPMRQRAVSVVGRFRSGQSDIAKRHDDYLLASYLK